MTSRRYNVVEHPANPHYPFGVYDSESQREIVLAPTRERADNHCARLNALDIEETR